ncbi:hypothetical protein [Egicoccus halophilus]|uniref:Uncharacterized protein n=1 Tax=Egicoccus halophilus TaxID=1670830 RepID=A0A8J3AG93_9ACTN|nr:hypothetical protein [Egicoccus halophilus]GGI08675.1 hypothetical protein GCM10011354_30280 [Egicoccus halophilus]
MAAASAAAAVVLAVLHALAGRVRGLHVVPRSWLLSAGSGVSAAYVFVHLLPELAHVQDHLVETSTVQQVPYLASHAWIVALAGLAAVYGLELSARRSRAERSTASQGDARGDAPPAPSVVGWGHVGSYAVYNAVIGYLLVERAQVSATTLATFAFAMGVHFLVNDHGLREHHAALYDGRGRWVVAAGVLVGWAVGMATTIAEATLGLLIAFLGGGIIMNVLKEELPADRRARWTPFALGATAYTVLLLAV